MLGFPILVIWVTVAPIVGLILLARNIKKGEDNKVTQYMLILYQGLRPEIFYWEFVNSLRKVLILIILALLASYSSVYKIMTAIIVLIVSFRIQVYLKPYKDPKNNDIEIAGLLAGALTLFSSIIFTREDGQVQGINAIILIVIFLINFKFMVQWTYLFII